MGCGRSPFGKWIRFSDNIRVLEAMRTLYLHRELLPPLVVLKLWKETDEKRWVAEVDSQAVRLDHCL